MNAFASVFALIILSDNYFLCTDTCICLSVIQIEEKTCNKKSEKFK